MKKIILLIVISIFTTSVSANTYVCGSKILLDGLLITGSVSADSSADEKAHKYPALKLKSAIDVNCEPDDELCEPEKNISLLQLAIGSKENMAQYKKLKGKEVKVYGELYHRDNGHHYTAILINVESIK